MDGVDAALLKTDGQTVLERLGHHFIPYPPEFTLELKAAEKAVRENQGDITGLEMLIQKSTHYHQQAVEALLAKTQIQKIDVIGYPGQTLFHAPHLKKSVTIGNAGQLSRHFQCAVVADFRRQDIEAGGQGAPFAPLYHQALALNTHQPLPLAVVNCGGIANITFITGPTLDDVSGFDTGPGNTLIDALVRERTQGLETCDFNGHYGQQGQVWEALFDTFYEHLFFKKSPPKSLDVGDFDFIDALKKLSLKDATATLEAFTADSIVKSLDWIPPPYPYTWILAGGGWKNPMILTQFQQRLQARLGAVCIKTADAAGWNSDCLEAELFAFLAVRSWRGLPLSVPKTTGVNRAVIGGTLFGGVESDRNRGFETLVGK
jgi:anhydro-N-acetylmuramic acid kinase